MDEALPFPVVFIVLFGLEHAVNILAVACAILVALRVGEALKLQVALRRAESGRMQLLAVMAAALGALGGFLAAFRQDRLWRSAILLPPTAAEAAPAAAEASVWATLLRVALVDTLVRFVSVAAKAAYLLAAPPGPGKPSFRRQAQVLTSLEHGAVFYRSCLPLPQWFCFFHCPGRALAVASLLNGVYLSMKLPKVWRRARLFGAALRAAHATSSGYGEKVLREDLLELGEGAECCICHAGLEGPVRLSCSHVFCEECISEWLDRDSTCPLCRKTVKPACSVRSYGDGSTNHVVQLF